jgi:hypothetical protein
MQSRNDFRDRKTIHLLTGRFFVANTVQRKAANLSGSDRKAVNFCGVMAHRGKN